VTATRFGIKLASHYLAAGELLGLAERVESRGYDSVWTTEGRMAPDSITTTAAIAARTRRVRIGTSVVNPYTRSPALIAVSAASIDQISGGRFVLGLGVGDLTTLDRQHIPHQRPLTRVRECVAVLRELWAGKRVTYAGESIELDDIALDVVPRQERLPIYVGATRPLALRQAARIGDGVLLSVCVDESVVARALDDRERGVRVVGNIVVGMHPDRQAALSGTKPLIVDYLTLFPPIAETSGVPDELVRELRAARESGMAEACKLLPDDQVTRLAAVGTPEDCRAWIRDHTSGMDEALLMPAFGDPAMIIDELAALLDP
jgi:5,10-methylenetetrahydromethanopterin reductase